MPSSSRSIPSGRGTPDKGSGGRPALIVALGVAISGVTPVFLTGALAVQLRSDLGMTPAALGGATTSFFGAAALGSILAGQVIERIGWRRAVLLATVVQIVVLVGIATGVQSVLGLTGFLALGGVAHALAMPAGNLAILRHVPQRRHAAALGLRQSAIPASLLVAGVAVPVIGLTWGWRPAFLIMVVGPCTTLAFIRRLPRSQTGHGNPSSPSLQGPPLWRSSGLRRMVMAGILGAFVINASSTFFLSSAVDTGLAVGTAASLLIVGSLIAILVRIVIGAIVDRLAEPGFVQMALLLAGGALGLLLLSAPTPVAAVVAAPLVFGAGTGWAGLLHHIVIAQHRHRAASASSLMLSFTYAGGALGPGIFGVIAGRLGYAPAWLLASSAAGLAAALVMGSRASYARAATSAASVR